jgi:SAM-dependent methyltransferase
MKGKVLSTIIRSNIPWLPRFYMRLRKLFYTKTRRRQPEISPPHPTPEPWAAVVQSYLQPNDVFVDLGCGRGDLVWHVATGRKIKKVIGIELFHKYAVVAKKNRTGRRQLSPVEIVEGNVADVDLCEGTVYYMFNPFGEKTLRRVLENIKKSYLSKPRGIRILYYNPAFAHVLDRTDWLQPEPIRFRVWRL